MDWHRKTALRRGIGADVGPVQEIGGGGLTGELGTVTALSPIQKTNEVAHIKSTSDLQNAAYTAYNDASGLIDAMAGVLGKGTPAAKKLQAIRSKSSRHNAANDPTPTPPAPTVQAPPKQ